MSERAPSRLPFDPREHHVLSGLARWMSLLGRFQIVVAVFLFVVLLAVAGLLTTAEVLGPAAIAVDSAEGAPLVSIGEVSRGVIAAVIAGVVAFTLIFLRGGMLLVSGAEDLEAVGSSDEAAARALEDALRRIRAYFVLEAVLMVGVTAATYAATLMAWGA